MQKNKKNIFLHRLKDLGPLGAWDRITHRAKRKLFAFKWKKRALAHTANHEWIKSTYGWKTIAKKHRLENFNTFFENLKKNSFNLPAGLEKKLLLEKADASCQNHFASNPTRWTKSTCRWKCDFPDLFYQEVQPANVPLGETGPDIKDPWEISRFQHLFHLGKAYELTKEKKYAQAFVDHVSDWIDKNHFLLGVNWVCPMEVGIRAINWIVAFEFFKHADICKSFWKKFVCSLYDHAFYLEHNWETSDRPNNHYIADLVGYFYLCRFFESIKHFEKTKKITHKKILEQFNHQIHPDGTSYEGSTAYHRLDTELFWLFSLQSNVDQTFMAKLSQMIEFCELCQINEKEFVQIGDNDSGKIIAPLRSSRVILPSTESASKIVSCNTNTTHHYPNFGLTIIKSQDCHITFRHPTYKSHQPTGHFHRDELSVTFAYKGVPILVDPGSYLYTSNPSMRNLFRSAQMHNVCHTKKETYHGIDLFQLPKQEQEDTAIVHENDKIVTVENSYEQWTRKIKLEKQTNIFSIEDRLETSNTLLFHPDITLKQKSAHVWTIFHKHEHILSLESNLTFSKTNGYFSPEYGIVETTTKLVASNLYPPSVRILPARQTQQRNRVP